MAVHRPHRTATVRERTGAKNLTHLHRVFPLKEFSPRRVRRHLQHKQVTMPSHSVLREFLSRSSLYFGGGQPPNCMIGNPLGTLAGSSLQRFCFFARSSSKPSRTNATRFSNSSPDNWMGV